MKLLKLVMLMAVFGAFGASIPVSEPDSGQLGFETMNDAAKAAEAVAMAESTAYEFGGGIYSRNGKFFYTLPVTDNNSLVVNYQIALFKGSKVVAMYHTHPIASAFDDGFSISDIRTAKKHDLVMYVGVVTKNHVLKYDPAKDLVVIDYRKSDGDVAPFHPSAI